MRIKLIISFFLFFNFTFLFVQASNNKSIITLLDSFQLTDVSKLQSYRDSLRRYRNELIPEDKIKYGYKGVEAAEKMNQDTLRIEFYLDFIIAAYSADLLNPKKSKEIIEYIEKDIQKLNSNHLNSKLYNRKGIQYQLEQNFVQALKMYNTSISYLIKNKEYENTTRTYSNISNIYQYLGDYNNAIKYAKEKLYLNKYFTSEKDILLNTALANYQVSINYIELMEQDSFHYYLSKAIHTIQKVDNLDNTLNGLTIYCDIYTTALVKLDKKNDIINIDTVFQKIKKCEEVKKIEYNLTLLEYYANNDNFIAINKILTDSTLYGINKSIDDQLLFTQFKYEAKVGNFQKAFQSLEAYHNSYIERVNLEKRRYASYFDAQFETIKKENKISQLNETNKKEQSKSRILFIVLLFSIALIALGSFLYSKIKQNNKFLKVDLENKKIIEAQANELKKLNQLKSKLFTNIAHELRTPLTLIISPIQHILKKIPLEETDKAQLLLAHNSSKQLLSISKQIMELTRKDLKELPLHLANFNWNDFLNKTMSPFKVVAKNSDITLEINNNIKENISIQSDFIKIKTVLNNLISNAFKYSVKEGKVSLTVNDKSDYLFLTIKDTGKGIPPEDIPYIFDRYFQSKVNKSPEGGFGIGLAVCKEYLAIMKGSIEVESTYGKGTSVYVKIPKLIDDTIDAPAFDIETTPELSFARNSLTSKKVIKKDFNHILVVEDNVDMRAFLKSILSNEYYLTFAPNGLKALELLESTRPSLILTDWMMPQMNGIELVSKLKDTPKFSNIPILMLTARNFSIDQIKALRKGVDDYLVKPFEVDNLKSRILYLLHSSENRKNMLSTNIKDNFFTFQMENLESNTKEILKKQNSKDIEWISNFGEIILQKIGDFDLSIDDLSQQMDISTPHLYRKVKSIIGMTPMQFVDEIRFWEARRLLEEKKVQSVKAVAYTVGLKSVKNFSRNFKKRFGLSPSEILKS